MNAIARLIDYLCDDDNDTMTLMNKQLHLVVTFSPCIECVELLGMFQQVSKINFRVYYEIIFDLLALQQLVTGLGIEAIPLTTPTTENDVQRQESKKRHTYSIQPAWEKKVTGIRIILQSNRSIVMERGMNDDNQLEPFDIRPYVMNAMLFHRQNSQEKILLYFNGQLNHREKLFINVLKVEFMNAKIDSEL